MAEDVIANRKSAIRKFRLADLEAEILKCENGISASRSAILKLQIADLEAEILKCRNGIEVAVARVASASAEYRVAEARFRGIRDEIREANATADSLKCSLMALRNELEKVKDESDA